MQVSSRVWSAQVGQEVVGRSPRQSSANLAEGTGMEGAQAWALG